MTPKGLTDGTTDFKDRKAGLLVFGILEILLGTFCALMAPFMIFGMLASAVLENNAAAPVGIGMMVPGLLFYILLAVWFIWMGIGSIKARRWARALLLVTSWLWLVSGILGLAFMLFLFPDIFNQPGMSDQVPPEVLAVMKMVMIGTMAVFYVIIPGALVFFYGSRHVKATCERRDLQPRWTDACPLPVLAVSLVAGFWAAGLLLMGFYGWAIPFFGTILSGVTGAVVTLLTMLLLGFVAWGTYRLDIRAWWCAVLLVAGWGLSAGLTFSRVSLMDYYEKMNFPEAQLEQIKQFALVQSPSMVLFSGLWVVIVLAYLLYTRTCFVRPPEDPHPS